MIFRAPEPPLTFPEVALTPFLLDAATARRSKPALIEGPTGRTLTYAEWARAVRTVAGSLARRGFRKGDVFAVYSPNLPEYAVVFHAVCLLGGIVTTINPLFTREELAKQLQDSSARYLVTIPPCLEKALGAARDAGVQEVFVFGEGDGAAPFASLLEGSGDPPVAAIDPREHIAALPYSSGTTGFPKGVMLTHYNLVANIIQTAARLDIRGSDTLLGVLPFFHIYGMVVIMNVGLYRGSTIVTMPRFDLEQCLDILQKYKVTFAPLVPPIVLALAKNPIVEKYDLSSIRTVFCGAAPLRENVSLAASARLGCPVIQGYGLTETSPVTHAARRSGGLKPESVGPPLQNTEAKVVDVTNGSELGANQEGEICVRGPQVMKGYLNRPDATSAMIDADGWLHTGDIGYADEEGCFFIVDRL
jgi:acyl-CoA synthetase (AMP-forming)/AMP-acid ligase II